MTQEQLKEIQNAVGKAIQTHVNGKIDKLTVKVDAYIADDLQWKQQAEPVIKMGENVQGFGKVSLYIVGFVAAVAGAFISITNLFKEQ